MPQNRSQRVTWAKHLSPLLPVNLRGDPDFSTLRVQHRWNKRLPCWVYSRHSLPRSHCSGRRTKAIWEGISMEWFHFLCNPSDTAGGQVQSLNHQNTYSKPTSLSLCRNPALGGGCSTDSSGAAWSPSCASLAQPSPLLLRGCAGAGLMGPDRRSAQENSCPSTPKLFFSFQISLDLQTHKQLRKWL